MKEILEVIQQYQLLNVLLTGVIYDDENPVRFSPEMDQVYLDFGNIYVRCMCSDNGIELLPWGVSVVLSLVNQITWSTDWKEEGYQPAVTTMEGLFTHGKGNYISAIHAVVESEAHYDKAVFRSIGFDIGKRSYLFLDTLTFNDGMNLGKRMDREIWLEAMSKEPFIEKTWMRSDISTQNIPPTP